MLHSELKSPCFDCNNSFVLSNTVGVNNVTLNTNGNAYEIELETAYKSLLNIVEASDMAKGATITVGSLSVANTNCPVALSLSNMPPCLGKIYPPVLSKFDYWHPRPYSHANVNQRWKLDLRAKESLFRARSSKCNLELNAPPTRGHRSVLQ